MASSIVVTGKIGPGETLTAKSIVAIGDITFTKNGTIDINGQSIDINAATAITVAVTAGAPPQFVFTVS